MEDAIDSVQVMLKGRYDLFGHPEIVKIALMRKSIKMKKSITSAKDTPYDIEFLVSAGIFKIN